MKSISEVHREIAYITNKLESLCSEIDNIKQSEKNESVINFEEINRIAKQYPIKEHRLENLDDYSKKIYLTLLSSIAQINRDNREEKLLFLNRILLGVNYSGDIEEVIKYGMEANEKTIDEFIKVIEDKHLIHLFVFESLLITNIAGQMDKASKKYISEIISYLKITKEEADFLMKLTVCVLEQSNEKYQQLSKKIPQTIDILYLFQPYLKNFYSGFVIDSKHIIYLYNVKNVDEILKSVLSRNLEHTEVLFENTNFKLEEISKDIIIQECKSIVFRNCTFVSNKQNIQVKNTRYIEFDKCNFYNFRNKVLKIREKCGELIIASCIFERCGYTQAHCPCGGCLEIHNLIRFIIKNSKFEECYLQGETWYGKPHGIICMIYNFITEFKITDTTFNKCNAYIKDSLDKENNIITYAGYDNEKSNHFTNCKFINSAKYY